MIIAGPLWTVDVRNGWRPTVPAHPTRPARPAGRTGGRPAPTAIGGALARAIQRADNGVSPPRFSRHFTGCRRVISPGISAGSDMPFVSPHEGARNLRGRNRRRAFHHPRRRALQLAAPAIFSAGTANFGRAAGTAAEINRRVTRWPY
jgi:hypothetical protein